MTPTDPSPSTSTPTAAAALELRRLLAEPSCIACLTGAHHPDQADVCGCPCAWPPDVLARVAVVSVASGRHPAGWAACHGAR